MTPADRLRAAAQKILDTHARTTALDWHEDGDRVFGWGDVPIARCYTQGDAAWIALLGPDKAQHLAAWLSDAADDIYPPGYIPGVTAVAALAFANSILGDTE